MEMFYTNFELITYGKGNKFDVAKFQPIQNCGFVKPKGGLWASPVSSVYGWSDWCKDNSFGDLSTSFTFKFTGKVFVIDGKKDACQMPWLKAYDIIEYPDFESLVMSGYDALYLTQKGEGSTRFGTPSLYGWDCESVLIMKPSSITTL